MSELDDKLNSILANPEMMQQIINLAQSLNSSDSGTQNENSPPPPTPSISPNLLNQMTGLMQRGTIDSNQQSLLKALSPYLSSAKLQKLERAMQAAKMAGIASDVISIRGNHTRRGR